MIKLRNNIIQQAAKQNTRGHTDHILRLATIRCASCKTKTPLTNN
ncbi:MAG: hypothetical protein PHC83_09795 [Bacteroidales bacterium]|nr:hypothetical protein [Bacteroidales bacterium]MDD4210532.1 hypothetical protein [Bacteroidales bacterium]